MHKVFIIEKFEIELEGKNVSSNVSTDAILGLAPSKDSDINHESYGEYLTRRNFISNNSLAIVVSNITDPNF